nr:MAG TPA: hypothetical protein [Bacteriophage sp.]
MADLKTNYVDDVLDTTKNQLRKYQQIQNDDGTVSFVDVTEYTQVGTSFGAKDINDTNAAINDVNGKLSLLQHYKVIEGTNTGNTLTFTLASVSGWSSKLYLVINFDCRSTYSVDLTGIYLVKYHANTANIGTVTIKEISGKIPNCAIVNNQIILTYTADQNILGSNKIICMGA